MNLFGRTDIGCVRSSNQDAYLSGSLPNGAAWTVVCDGMGGANGGNIASLTAVEVISAGLKAMSFAPGTDAAAYLLELLAAANRAVYEKAQQEPSLMGMGTTAVVALVHDGHCTIAHVGDSRAYLFRDRTVRQLTEDHSVVQELVRIGELTPEQARTHPRRNIITRAVGVGPLAEPDVTTIEFRPGDVLLSCTDGLSGYLTEDELGAFMNEYKGQTLVDHLLDHALQAGGADNITVSVIEND